MVSICFFVASLCVRGKRRERKLGNLHTGAEHDRDAVEVAELERNVEVVAGVHD